jgi:ABC-type glutathione transport system ATPase component
MKVLGLDGVTRRFGDFVAVRDLSFSIDSGHVVGFLGPNGAGKTTTLRMILDILRPSSGTIEVLGGPPGRQKAAEIGFLPEERGLYPGMSVLQTVVYFGQLKGLSRSASQSAAARLIERFGLAEFRDPRLGAVGVNLAFGRMMLPHAAASKDGCEPRNRLSTPLRSRCERCRVSPSGLRAWRRQMKRPAEAQRWRSARAGILASAPAGGPCRAAGRARRGEGAGAP